MLNKFIGVFSCILMFSLFTMHCFADNPVIQTCFTADPAPMVYDSTVYMYIDEDSSGAPNDSYLMRNYKCYSSKDMVNWTDLGTVLNTYQINWSTVRDANAAQVIYRNGKFYYYISTTGSSGVSIGVAVASNPAGPFVDIGNALIPTSLMTGCATHSWRGLDPTVYIDDDGQAYLYWGNNALYWVKLNSDMVSYSGSISCLPPNNTAFGPDYEEAPWFCKRNNHYYMIFSSGFPESICYSMSSAPTGPWTYGGKIMPVEPSGSTFSNTIHSGVCDFGGNSYFFYHNGGLTNGGSYRRSVCIEQFKYNADGSIPTINETKDGVVKGVGNLNPYDTIEAETICWESGIRTEKCSEGGINVDSIHNDDYIKVKAVNFGLGASDFIARVSSATNGGAIELHIDSLKGAIIGTCSVQSTGDWKTWVTRTCTISGATGIHDLYLKFTGNSGLLFKFNWWKFNTATGTRLTNASKFNGSNYFRIKTCSKSASTIELDFDPSVSLTRARIVLFDLQGHQLSDLFNGQLSSSHLVLPLNRTKVPPGAYMIRVSLNDRFIPTERTFLLY